MVQTTRCTAAALAHPVKPVTTPHPTPLHPSTPTSQLPLQTLRSVSMYCCRHSVYSLSASKYGDGSDRDRNAPLAPPPSHISRALSTERCACVQAPSRCKEKGARGKVISSPHSIRAMPTPFVPQRTSKNWSRVIGTFQLRTQQAPRFSPPRPRVDLMSRVSCTLCRNKIRRGALQLCLPMQQELWLVACAEIARPPSSSLFLPPFDF